MSSIGTRDLPPLYCDFDSSSTSAQRAYLLVVCADLIVLTLAAAASAYSSPRLETQKYLHIAGALLLGVGLLITVVLSRNAYENTWYGGRAAAETVKSLAWKYMLRAAPFEGSATSEEIDRAFISKLASILHERRALALSRSSVARAGEPITRKMRSVRATAVRERVDIYLAERVQNQIVWYSTKSISNDHLRRLWLYGIIGVQGLALLGAIAQVANPAIAFNYASTLATVATGMLAWSQLKRYRELAQSYSIAAHELGLAAGLAAFVANEEKLSQFVNDTETAISREHTMWIARREAAP